MDRRRFLRSAGALGLAAGLPSTVRAGADLCRGTVAGGGRPLPGVRVSDGCRVVTTDADGRFTLPLDGDSGPFVFVTTPAGYWTDAFYVPAARAAAAPVHFGLDRRGQSEDHLSLFLTDVHLGERGRKWSYDRFAATIDEINALDPAPAFVWCGGDITLQGGRGKEYADMTARLKVPVRHTAGNHEMLVGRPDPRAEFHGRFGPTYYSFDVGGAHYVALDGCRVVPEEKGYRNVHGRVSDRELHWLAEDLKHVPDGMPTVLTVHVPLLSTYPQRRDVAAKDVPWWVASNADAVLDLLAKHRVPLVLQGHLHENERLLKGKTEFVTSISVCGRWWQAADGREDGVGGEPRGYRRVEVRGGRVSHAYVSSAESRVNACGEVAGRPGKLAAGRPADLLVNIFDSGSRTVVRWQIDDGPWVRLKQVTPVGKHEGARMAHHWAWPVDAPALRPGKHRLRVRCEEEGQAEQGFEHAIEAGA